MPATTCMITYGRFALSVLLNANLAMLAMLITKTPCWFAVGEEENRVIGRNTYTRRHQSMRR